MKEFKSFYKTVSGNEGDRCIYPTRLDTYGCGCCNDCSYCYAKSLLEFRNLWNPQDPSVANIEKVKNQIKKIPKGTIVRLGGMTDCFQAVEKTHRVTYETIKALNAQGVGYLIVTKCPLVASDEYIDIMDKRLAHIQISITTTDDDFNKTYEHTNPFSERVKAIEKLQGLGFDVSVRLSPFIPQFIDYGKLNNIKCDKILVEFLRVNHWIKQWFDIDYSEYTLSHKGYQHLPLDKKLVYISKITGFKEISVCEDVDEHYLYWKYHFNHNKDDCCNLRQQQESQGGVALAKVA